eukprot:m.24240 g.24240  ORF g.24240 m.24240 type:complete len:929 (+) comp7589_c0_seq2:398-3184(+)
MESIRSLLGASNVQDCGLSMTDEYLETVDIIGNQNLKIIDHLDWPIRKRKDSAFGFWRYFLVLNEASGKKQWMYYKDVGITLRENFLTSQESAELRQLYKLDDNLEKDASIVEALCIEGDEIYQIKIKNKRKVWVLASEVNSQHPWLRQKFYQTEKHSASKPTRKRIREAIELKNDDEDDTHILGGNKKKSVIQKKTGTKNKNLDHKRKKEMQKQDEPIKQDTKTKQVKASAKRQKIKTSPPSSTSSLNTNQKLAKITSHTNPIKLRRLPEAKPPISRALTNSVPKLPAPAPIQAPTGVPKVADAGPAITQSMGSFVKLNEETQKYKEFFKIYYRLNLRQPNVTKFHIAGIYNIANKDLRCPVTTFDSKTHKRRFVLLNRAHLSRIVNHGMHCVAQPGHEHQVWSQSVSGELGNTAWKKRMTQGLVLSRFFDTVSPKRLNKGEELIIGFVKVIMPVKDDPKILSPSYIRDDWLHGKCAFLLSEEAEKRLKDANYNSRFENHPEDLFEKSQEFFCERRSDGSFVTRPTHCYLMGFARVVYDDAERAKFLLENEDLAAPPVPLHKESQHKRQIVQKVVINNKSLKKMSTIKQGFKPEANKTVASVDNTKAPKKPSSMKQSATKAGVDQMGISTTAKESVHVNRSKRPHSLKPPAPYTNAALANNFYLVDTSRLKHNRLEVNMKVIIPENEIAVAEQLQLKDGSACIAEKMKKVITSDKSYKWFLVDILEAGGSRASMENFDVFVAKTSKEVKEVHDAAGVHFVTFFSEVKLSCGSGRLYFFEPNQEFVKFFNGSELQRKLQGKLCGMLRCQFSESGALPENFDEQSDIYLTSSEKISRKAVDKKSIEREKLMNDVEKLTMDQKQLLTHSKLAGLWETVLNKRRTTEMDEEFHEHGPRTISEVVSKTKSRYICMQNQKGVCHFKNCIFAHE